jgi:hypothetical protein
MYGSPLASYERADAAAGDPIVSVAGEEPAAAEAAARLAMLRMEHRDLDAAIEALRAAPATDQLQLARLKKRKLRLKDEIAMLEDLAVPDIIA